MGIFFTALFFFVSAPSLAADITWEKFPTGVAKLHLEGKITEGDVERFHRAILEIKERGLIADSINLISPGGSVAVGLELGRRIRTLQLTTLAPFYVHKTKVATCHGTFFDREGNLKSRRVILKDNKKCVCASACFLVWSGGIGRVGGRIGVHRPSYVDAKEFGSLSLLSMRMTDTNDAHTGKRVSKRNGHT